MAGVELILSSHIKDMNSLVLVFTEAFKEHCIQPHSAVRGSEYHRRTKEHLKCAKLRLLLNLLDFGIWNLTS